MNIVSPEFSFLDFDYIENTECSNEIIPALPACNDLGIKAQFDIITDEDTLATIPFYAVICDEDCNIIYEDDIEIQPICSKYKFYTTFEEFEIGEDNPFNLCNTTNDEPTSTQDFTTNPFDEITSTDLEFDLTFPIEDQLQFYFEDKIYIIEWKFAASAPYSYTQMDNVYFVTVASAGIGDDAISRNRFLAFLNEVIDVNHGTTSSLSSPTFTIADVPTGSYLNNSYDFINTISTVTPSTNTGKSFYWKNSVNYLQINGTNTSLSYGFETSLTFANSYNFKIAYTSIYNDMIGTITIDDGSNPPEVIAVSFDSYSGEIDVFYDALDTSTHTITLEITDNQTHNNGLTLTSIKQYNTERFNVTENISGNVPVGIYSKAELIDLISSILGFDFDCEFTSCCEVTDIEFIVTTRGEDVSYNYKLSPYWQKGFLSFPELPLDTINQDCFTYGITDSGGNLIACSNLFKKEEDCCYITKIEYSNNEDAFGFTYPTGVTNSISLPFYLHSPSYPVTEKIYKQTNGIYKRLSADIEKEYLCETDYFNEELHDKIITALKHDTLIVTSNRLDFTGQMSQQGDYELNWNSKIEFTAMAEFKLKKYFNGKNNNCGQNC